MQDAKDNDSALPEGYRTTVCLWAESTADNLRMGADPIVLRDLAVRIRRFRQM